MLKDFVFFPFRVFTLFEKDRWGLSSLATERFDYVAREVTGYCLDVGCGRNNRLINEYLGGEGKGIDVYPYEGLTEEHVVKDISKFPFADGSFGTVTFIANLNHVPEGMRDIELKEAFRCLKRGGRIVVTMGNPWAEICAHKLVFLCDKVLGTKFDMDSERGMSEDEEYYLLDSEIRARLVKAGFVNLKKKYFTTQWFLNHLITGERPS